jgi:hypothetical protein
MAKPLVPVFVILLVTGVNRATAGDVLLADALQCSNATLNQYALSSTDPAEKVAEAAFEKCSDRWREAAEALSRSDQVGNSQVKEAYENCLKKLGYDYCHPTLPPSGYYLNAARRQFEHDAAVKVFDIRAKAAGR